MPCPSLGWAARLDLARPLAASFGSKGYASGYEKWFSRSPEEILKKLPPRSPASIFFLFFVVFVAAAVLSSVPDVVSVSAGISGAVGMACDAGAVAVVGA